MAVHRPEKPCKIFALQGEKLIQGFLTFQDMPCHDHSLDGGHPFCFKKHVLGTAEADSLCSIFPRPLCVSGVVGIGPNPELADFIRPAQ